MLGLCALVALAIARSERRLEGTIKNLRDRPLIEANLIVKKMKEYASRTKWVYSESGIYPFHAKLLVPPELAIIMPKRFWSGQITTKEIVETCRRYQPELIVLPIAGNKFEWKPLLDGQYVATSIDKKNVLYVAKRVNIGNAP